MKYSVLFCKLHKIGFKNTFPLLYFYVQEIEDVFRQEFPQVVR